MYEKANSVVSYDVVCPTWLHKYIIGKKGASIQKLTSELTKVTSDKLIIYNYVNYIHTSEKLMMLSCVSFDRRQAT